METPLLTEALTAIMADALYTAEKKEEVNKQKEEIKEKTWELDNKVIEASQELTEALKNSFQQFKLESLQAIIVCERSIAKLKIAVKNIEHEKKAKYRKNYVFLEQKKNNLKMKLENYIDEGQDKWTFFKTDFKSNLEYLQEKLKHFSVSNL